MNRGIYKILKFEFTDISIKIVLIKLVNQLMKLTM